MSGAINALELGLERGEFLISLEYCLPPRGEPLDTLEAMCDYVRSDDRIHAIALTDRVTSETDYDPIEQAVRVMERSGKVPLVHLSGKDQTPESMRRRLEVCRRLGLRNVLPITGDMPRQAPEDSGAPAPTKRGTDDAAEIWYVDSVQSLVLARQVDEHFLLAAATSSFKYTEPQLMGQYGKMVKKLRWGARLIFNQVGYDLRKTQELMLYARHAGLALHAIAALYWLTPGFARFAHAGNVPGVIITADLCERIAQICKQPDRGKQARTDMMAVHILLCKQFGYRGVHIGGLRNPQSVQRILDHAARLEAEGLDLDALWERWCGHMRFDDGREVRCGPPEGFYLFEADERGLNRQDRPAPGEPVEAGLKYRLLQRIHDVLFERALGPGRTGERLVRALAAIPGLPQIGYVLERAIKGLLVGCRGCGSCSLPETEYVCVEGECAKRLLNGPCGGSRLDGSCEVYPDRTCAWVEIYRRAKAHGDLAVLQDGRLLVKDPALRGSCSWINLALGRDHHAGERGNANRPDAEPDRRRRPRASAGA